MTESNLKEMELEVKFLREDVLDLRSQIHHLKKLADYYQRTERKGTCENCNNQVATLYVINDGKKSMSLLCDNCARAYNLGKTHSLMNRIFRKWKR